MLLTIAPTVDTPERITAKLPKTAGAPEKDSKPSPDKEKNRWESNDLHPRRQLGTCRVTRAADLELGVEIPPHHVDPARQRLAGWAGQLEFASLRGDFGTSDDGSGYAWDCQRLSLHAQVLTAGRDQHCGTHDSDGGCSLNDG